MTFAKTTSLSLGLASALILLCPTLSTAQPIYRIVGPDGRVSFSDKPPARAEKATTLGPGGRSSDNVNTSNLPFEIRDAVNKYPVTLYTANDCAPCNAARAMLNLRGVPHVERTITNTQDVEALKRLGMEASFPILTIGAQRLRGYTEAEWSDYLDSTGYPKTSRLPIGYRNPAPTPMAPPTDNIAAQPESPSSAPAAPAVPLPTGPTPSNPAGIVF